MNADERGYETTKTQRHQDCKIEILPNSLLRDFMSWWLNRSLSASIRVYPRPNPGPRSRHRSSKPNLRELGGKARGSTPPRASKIIDGCVAQVEQSKRLISARLVVQLHPQPPKFRAGDVTESIEVLQTSCEGLNPSQSTKLRRSSNGSRALVL